MIAIFLFVETVTVTESSEMGQSRPVLQSIQSRRYLVPLVAH